MHPSLAEQVPTLIIVILIEYFGYYNVYFHKKLPMILHNFTFHFSVYFETVHVFTLLQLYTNDYKR